MRRALPALLIVGALVTACSVRPATPTATASADVPTYRGDAGRSGRMPGPGPTESAAVRWTFKAGGPIQSQVIVVSGVVYVVATDGILHAVALATGAEQWRTDLGARSYSSPTRAGDLVLLGADDGMHALRLADGTPGWTTSTTGAVRGTAVVVDNVAICLSTSGLVSALDVRSGASRWTRQLESGGDTSVAAANGMAIIGLDDGTVVALDVADGSERWHSDIGDGARVGTPTIVGDRVFVVTLDGGSGHHIAALDLASGQAVWRVPSPGGEATYSPALVNGLAVAGGEDSSVTALEASTGTVTWQAVAPGKVEIVTAAAGSTIYSASNGGTAFALDAATGAERWRIPIKGVPYGVAVTSGVVLVGTSAGSLYAIGEPSWRLAAESPTFPAP